MDKPVLNFYFQQFQKENKKILTTSDLQTIAKFIESLPNDFDLNGNKQLQANIHFDGEFYKIGNKSYSPVFLQEYKFEDEYEANLAFTTWKQYSKGKNYTITPEIISDFFHILKANLLIIGRLSNFVTNNK